MLSFPATMGPYDHEAVVDAPSDEVAAAYALKLAAQGNVTMLLVKAFSVEQMGVIVAKLPRRSPALPAPRRTSQACAKRPRSVAASSSGATKMSSPPSCFCRK